MSRSTTTSSSLAAPAKASARGVDANAQFGWLLDAWSEAIFLGGHSFDPPAVDNPVFLHLLRRRARRVSEHRLLANAAPLFAEARIDAREAYRGFTAYQIGKRRVRRLGLRGGLVGATQWLRAESRHFITLGWLLPVLGVWAAGAMLFDFPGVVISLLSGCLWTVTVLRRERERAATAMPRELEEAERAAIAMLRWRAQFMLPRRAMDPGSPLYLAVLLPLAWIAFWFHLAILALLFLPTSAALTRSSRHMAASGALELLLAAAAIWAACAALYRVAAHVAALRSAGGLGPEAREEAFRQLYDEWLAENAPEEE